MPCVQKKMCIRDRAEIDRQLYRKYDLTADEIEFIETHVKEMA